ncbi:hypothetical protein [Hymenobacter sp. HDW8]|uniref:HD domain-containing protein n=1 Tax=Hymenobacter sp. HDW8 TaxID=2714932 RepID=UPI00140825E8|nr:hypothetical protein [Hymenobacter sp. HDW8]QIL76027.1 hypothetical protein G7064_09290 [Hymenobacter sp. HDW8]
MTTDLAAHWYQLTTPFTPDAAVRTATFEQLAVAYESSGRHYHTLTHIRALLWAVEEFPLPLNDIEAVQLAIWFHDAVYNSMRTDNEARSAELARQFLAQTTLGSDRTNRVAFLIEQTKDHTQPQPNDPDLHFFLDADLQILGAPELDYQQYAQQIRQEYWLVPGPLYRRGRRAVLQKMLDTVMLYRTEFFREKLETRARYNLQAELESL